MPIRVLIVEDEPLIAEDIADCLIGAGFAISHIVHDAVEARKRIEEGDFDIALLDITLGKEQSGLALGEFIHQQGIKPFCFLTSHTDRLTLEKAKLSMPASYLVKPFREDDLIIALELATASFFQRTSRVLTIETINHKLPAPLSEREFDVLIALRDGSTNKDISERLFISVNTVKTHLLNIFVKFDVKNRTELMFKLDKF